MKRVVTVVVIFITATSIFSACARQAVRAAEEEPTPVSSGPWDPLTSVTDREVVPEIYPKTMPAVGSDSVSLRYAGTVDSSTTVLPPEEKSPADVYRVQIFTSRLYAEALRERAIANEVFNLPVHLDYEVPYYKLRVGDFFSREEAEEIIPEVRSIGYTGAWVARVIKNVYDGPDFEQDEEPLLPSDTTDIRPGDTTRPEDNR